MGDAYSDMIRDGERANLTTRYFITLLGYLRKKNTLEELQEAAQQSDSIRNGWRERTTFAEKQDWVEALAQGDQETWTKFLFRIKNYGLFQDFKEVSPFKGKTLLMGECDNDGTMKLSGLDISEILDKVLPEVTKFPFHQKFIIVLEDSGLKGSTGISLGREVE